jgi:hypothetical protein
METERKLARLLPHWIEHNREHAESYREWAGKANEAGLTDVAKGIEEAIAAIEKANGALERSFGLVRENAS